MRFMALIIVIAALVWSSYVLAQPVTGRIDIWIPRGAKPTCSLTAGCNTYRPCVRMSSMNFLVQMQYWLAPPADRMNAGLDCRSMLGLSGRPVRFIPLRPKERAEKIRTGIAGLIMTSVFAVAVVSLGGSILMRRKVNV